MSPAEQLVSYARTYFGVHYKWGGNTRYGGMDCSGFVCDVLRRPGVVARRLDLSSQDLHDYLLTGGAVRLKEPEMGAILFFGSPRINHVAIALDERYMIESGGGDSLTETLDDAIAMNAGVRESLISSRRGLRAVIMPNYE